ncbi:hypothetical protein ACWGH7_23515 [Streptomyces cyaneofuscatus]|uniref:hypothetical protein n=1 Tax=Streptomyces TaxID=1883 RepID=UPI0003A8DC4C|nr:MULTISPECIES: hypothetical protein [Streptomyces]MZF55597.1 hypothetical protein [Streptomyces sp. SID5594]ONI53899.1 hypothetical protein STIB_16050 [Streptomyces sp. IB2014 011-1]RDV52131.1 hypothetical protein DDV98_08000 [Streptomyces sp. IB2014 011-12]WOP11721.1 hypothetical protein R2B67_25700 [Streptomyces cyaneofuscatus]
MYTQERTAMSNLVVGGPVAVNSYDNAIVAALLETRPVMLVHAFNGGYLRPAELKEQSHDKGVQLSTALDPATKEAKGHLWYITPGGFFGQRPLYFIESAAGQVSTPPPAPGTAQPPIDAGRGDDGVPKPQRRRITVHQEAPQSGADTLQVGLPGKVGEKWRGRNGTPEDTQLWVVTVTPWGGITFVPITHPDAILGFKDHAVTANGEARLTYNWGGDFTGTVINTFYPRLPNEWNVPYHHVFT